MAIYIISVSSDSSKESVGTSTGRVILFGTIPTTIPDTTLSITPPSTHIDTTPIPIFSTTIPPSPDYTPASPDYSPAFDTESGPSEDLSLDHIPPLPTTLPFVSSTDDSSNYDIPDTPPSPTHGTPFTETTFSTQRSPTASGSFRRRVMVLAHGQPIPHGRPYHYHLNGPVHMMTARKRVRPLPTYRLAVRHSVDYSSSDHFTSDDSLRDSSSSSSSETSSDSPSDDLSNSSSDHSLPAPSSGMRPSHHLCSLVPIFPLLSTAITDKPSHDSSFVSPSCKRSRSPAVSVPLSSPIPRALSYTRADLLPSPKRIRSSDYVMDLEDSSTKRFKPSRSRETELEMDVDVERSDRIDIDLEIQEEIDEYIAYADALRDKGIDARVVVEVVDRDEVKTSARGPVEVVDRDEVKTSARGPVKVRVDRVTHPVIADDIPEPAHEEGGVEAEIDEYIAYVDALRDKGIDARVVVEVVDRDEVKTSARGPVEVRVDRVTHPVIADDIPEPAHEEGAVEVTYKTLKYLVQRFHDHTVEIPVPRVQAIKGNGNGGNGYRENGNEGNGNGGNRNRGNENGNGNGNEGGCGYNFGGFMPAKECTYQDFLKCQPLNFNGTEGVVGLTHWFEKMDTVFHISNCVEKYQVKYATYILLNSALTWWNSHKRIIRIEAMSWAELMKLMTEVYCPRNEVQKMETELWNLAVKGNDLTAYT
nr:reverse transcriptase domain-containing protein [Tanacetum cinerariifolium]